MTDDNVPANTIEKGRRRTIKEFLTKHGRSYFKDFYKDEVENDQRRSAKTWEWIKQLANRHRILNTQKFRKLKGEIYELKPTRQLRYLGFFYGKEEKVWKRDCFIITHGFKKQSQKTPRKEIKRARNCRKRFLINLNKGG